LKSAGFQRGHVGAVLSGNGQQERITDCAGKPQQRLAITAAALLASARTRAIGRLPRGYYHPPGPKVVQL